MPSRRTRPIPPGPVLLRRVEDARAELRAAQAELASVLAGPATPETRRAAYRRVSRAFEALEAPLREAARATKGAPYGKGWYRPWSHWRHLLSATSAARVRHMFAMSNDATVLGLGSVRALDSGMLGPSVGDMLHGRSVLPGAPARYGLDMAAVTASAADHPLRRGVGGVQRLRVVEGAGAVQGELPGDVDVEAAVPRDGHAVPAAPVPDGRGGAVVPA